jgi:hypothetical protein
VINGFVLYFNYQNYFPSAMNADNVYIELFHGPYHNFDLTNWTSISLTFDILNSGVYKYFNGELAVIGYDHILISGSGQYLTELPIEVVLNIGSFSESDSFCKR